MKFKFGGTYYNEMFKPFGDGFAELCRCCRSGMTMCDACLMGAVIGILLLVGALEVWNAPHWRQDSTPKAGDAKKMKANR